MGISTGFREMGILFRNIQNTGNADNFVLLADGS